MLPKKKPRRDISGRKNQPKLTTDSSYTNEPMLCGSDTAVPPLGSIMMLMMKSGCPIGTCHLTAINQCGMMSQKTVLIESTEIRVGMWPLCEWQLKLAMIHWMRTGYRKRQERNCERRPRERVHDLPFNLLNIVLIDVDSCYRKSSWKGI
jgi:hypothetical protein